MSCGSKFIAGEMEIKRHSPYLAGALFLVLGLFFWQLPTLLKAMPSRYVARMPEPLQSLGTRGDGEALLPTVSAPVAAAALLQAPALPSSLVVIQAATATSLPRIDETAVFTPTPLPTPKNTPVPIPRLFVWTALCINSKPGTTVGRLPLPWRSVILG